MLLVLLPSPPGARTSVDACVYVMLHFSFLCGIAHARLTTPVHILSCSLPKLSATVRGQVDTVVWCTGYNYSFPFLEGSGLLTPPVSERVHPLYEHVFHVHHPSLTFIGLPQRYECAARATVAVLLLFADMRAFWSSFLVTTPTRESNRLYGASEQWWFFTHESVVFQSRLRRADSNGLD